MMGVVKDKIMSLFRTNITKDYSKPTCVNNVYGGGKKPKRPKSKKQYKYSIIKNARNLFRIRKGNEPI